MKKMNQITNFIDIKFAPTSEVTTIASRLHEVPQVIHSKHFVDNTGNPIVILYLLINFVK